MASDALQAPPEVIVASDVGNAFVGQYYGLMYSVPEHLPLLYRTNSRIGRPGLDEKRLVVSTLQEAIDGNLLTLTNEEFRAAELKTLDCQESYCGGILVVVTGCFQTNVETIKRKFIQTFFLAPQEIGYFVLNDILRLVDEEDTKTENTVSELTSKTLISPHVPSQEDNPTEQSCKNLKNGTCPVMEEKSLVPEVINKAPELEMTSKEATDHTGPHDVPKITYASVVMKEKTGVSVASLPLPQLVSKEEDQQVASDLSPSVESETVLEAEVDNHDCEVAAESESVSIYVKGLPPTANPSLLENEFKQFGTIKSGGIQVKNQWGFAFGFVEFEEADAARKAIEASLVIIGGRKVTIEEKRSTSRGGNNSGRPSSGLGYRYRNEGGRGRGGGRWNSRGNIRSGGYSYRRGSGGRGSYVSVNNNNNNNANNCMESEVSASA